MRRSFRRHMVSAFLQLVVLPLSMLGLLIVLWFLFSVQNQARGVLQQAAGRIQTLLDAHLTQHRSAVDVLASSLQHSGLDGPPDSMESLLDLTNQNYPGIMTMLVADSSGLVIAASPSRELRRAVQERTTVADRDYFQVPMLRGGNFVSDVFQGRGFGDDAIAVVSRRLELPDGTPFGIVQGSLNLNTIAQFDRLIESISQSEMLIVDGVDRVVGTSHPDRYPVLSDLPGDWQQVPDEACQLPLSRGCFTAVARLETVDWRVLVRQPISQIYRPLLLFLLFISAALAMAVLVALMEGQRLARGTAGPLADLADAVSRSDVETHRELPSVPGGSPREVAVLHDAFEALLDKLSGYNTRLGAQMEKLEAQVEVRTEELEKSRSDLFQFLESAPALILSIGSSGYLVYGNRACRVALGYNSAELENLTLRDVLTDDGETSAEQILRLEPGQRVDEVDCTFRGKTGQLVHVAGSVSCERGVGGEVTTRAILRDVTELREAEQALSHKSELLDLFVRHAPVAVAMFDTEVRYLAASERWLADYGLEESGVLGRSLYEVFPHIPDHWQELHQRVLEGEVISSNEDPYQHPDGRIDWLRWEARPWRDASGAIGGLIIHLHVVTEEKQLIDQLRDRAERDPLTGLLNRRSLLVRLDALCQDPDLDLVVAYIDLDHFKAINEEHGHLIGDEILATVARRLKKATRSRDLVCRISSDKFVVVFVEIDDGLQPDALVERIMDQVDQPVKVEGITLRVGLSIGITVREAGLEPADLLRLADEAMYRIRAGRGTESA